MTRAAVGAIRPRNVNGGISARAIFRNGQETPHPKIATARKMYACAVRPLFSG